MQIIRPFDKAHFLMSLNGLFEIRPSSKAAAPAEQYKEAGRIFTDELRSLVDEWLDFGLNPDKSEEPKRRMPRENGKRVLREFRNANQPYQYLSETGETEFSFPLPERTRLESGIEDPVAYAWREAHRLFSDFMEERNFKMRFGKCRTCKVYFERPRKLEDKYQFGIHCEQCRNRVSASRSQKRKRDPWIEKAISLAARAWSEWNQRKRTPRPVWVASQVNMHLGAQEKMIRRNFVTLHETEIKMRAELLNREGTNASAFPGAL